MSNHTPGNWQLGKTGGTVVTDVIPDNALTHTGHSDKEYYGGYLIAESILSKDDAKLISSAPDLLNACKRMEDFVRRCLTLEGRLKQSEIDFICKPATDAIQKATQLDNQK